MNTELLERARIDIETFIDDDSLALDRLESALALINQYLREVSL